MRMRWPYATIVVRQLEAAEYLFPLRQHHAGLVEKFIG